MSWFLMHRACRCPATTRTRGIGTEHGRLAGAMARVLTILGLVMLSLQATSVTSVLEGDDCARDCDPGAPAGPCAPNCPSCVCCAAPKIVASSISHVAPVAPSARRAWLGPELAPPMAEPREILHVPRPLLG